MSKLCSLLISDTCDHLHFSPPATLRKSYIYLGRERNSDCEHITVAIEWIGRRLCKKLSSYGDYGRLYFPLREPVLPASFLSSKAPTPTFYISIVYFSFCGWVHFPFFFVLSRSLSSVNDLRKLTTQSVGNESQHKSNRGTNIGHDFGIKKKFAKWQTKNWVSITSWYWNLNGLLRVHIRIYIKKRNVQDYEWYTKSKG